MFFFVHEHLFLTVYWSNNKQTKAQKDGLIIMPLLFRQLSEQRWRSRQSEEAARVTEQGNKGRPEELIFTAVGGNTRPAKISVSLKLLLFCFVQLSTQWSVFCRQPGDMTMEHIKKVQINNKKNQNNEDKFEEWQLLSLGQQRRQLRWNTVRSIGAEVKNERSVNHH